VLPVRISLLIALVSLSACSSVKSLFRSPDQAPPLERSRQAIVVLTDGWDAKTGTMQRFERESTNGEWREVGARVPIVVGRNGLAKVGEKHEGDGRAPAGIYPLGTAFGFDEDAPNLRIPYRQVVKSTECVDDSASRFYNQIVERDAVSKVDWSSSEKMRSIDQYRWGIVVNYNTPPQPQKGSCIFLHIWSGPTSSTAGCTAMRQSDMDALLRWLDPAAHPVLFQFPKDDHPRFP
jgi:D-alanyl-D-alanine dipeptidase